VTRLDEVTCQCATSASKLEHDTMMFTNGLEEGHDARCARIGMEPIPAMVHEGEIAPVVRLRGDGSERYAGSLPAASDSPEMAISGWKIVNRPPLSR
jgi:hypothetical protein